MELEIKTFIHETGARRHLFGVLPALRALPDEEAVAAHQRKDTGEIAAILDEFIAARCVIKGGPTPTVPH